MAKKQTPPDPIRSRIVGHGDVNPEDLLANPLNFRVHPGQQMDALRGSMKELGWLKTILVNKRTGHVMDGHARVKEALRLGLPTIPATILDLSEDEERLALAVLDPITEMATRDEAMLRDLVGQIETEQRHERVHREHLPRHRAAVFERHVQPGNDPTSRSEPAVGHAGRHGVEWRHDEQDRYAVF